MNRRNAILGTLLAVTIALSAWTLMTPDDAVVESVARPAKSAVTAAMNGADRPHAPAAPAPPLAGDPAGHPPAPATAHNLFSSYTYRSAAPPPVDAAPEPPHAPPLPFVYTGRLDIDDRTTYLLLLHGDTPIRATVGTAIGDFTLVEISGPNLVFQYGPTGERVVMPIISAFN